MATDASAPAMTADQAMAAAAKAAKDLAQLRVQPMADVQAAMAAADLPDLVAKLQTLGALYYDPTSRKLVAQLATVLSGLQRSVDTLATSDAQLLVAS